MRRRGGQRGWRIHECGRSREEDAASTVGELRKNYLREQWWNTGAGRLLHDVGLDLLQEGFD